MRLHEIAEKLQKNEIWQTRPKGYWRFGEKAHIAVVGMSDRLTVFYDPETINSEGELRIIYNNQPFVPTFEDFRRDDWIEIKVD